ncbi:MAG TPA: hypothetical protein VEX65_01640 [Flavisolibacter sp.]|jgi:hypothetical protein|nr:hypothetical protein [Flavisolibacter sp.]
MAKGNNYSPEQQKEATGHSREKFNALFVLLFQGLMVIAVKHIEITSLH